MLEISLALPNHTRRTEALYVSDRASMSRKINRLSCRGLARKNLHPREVEHGKMLQKRMGTWLTVVINGNWSYYNLLPPFDNMGSWFF